MPTANYLYSISRVCASLWNFWQQNNSMLFTTTSSMSKNEAVLSTAIVDSTLRLRLLCLTAGHSLTSDSAPLFVVANHRCKNVFYVFSERELTFTFAIWYRPSVCRLSVVCLSSVTLVRPTQAVQIFRNISMAFGILAIRWHPLKISRRSSQRNPSAGGVKHKRGSQVYRFRTYRATAISRKWCKIGRKLVLITNRKLYMSFRLVPKSVTLNGAMAVILRYFSEFR